MYDFVSQDAATKIKSNQLNQMNPPGRKSFAEIQGPVQIIVKLQIESSQLQCLCSTRVVYLKADW